MRLRSIVAAGVYASMVPLASGIGDLATPGTPVAMFDATVTAGSEQAAMGAPGTAGDIPVHARAIERRDASSGLAGVVAEVRRDVSGPVWLAWTVPAVEQRRDTTHITRGELDTSEESSCVLTTDGDLDCNRTVGDGTAMLIVLARLEGADVDRVAFVDARRRVDAGTQRVVWLDRVRPAESVALLAEVVRQEARIDKGDGEHSDGRGRKPALTALALSGDPSADRALESFVEPDSPRWLRRDAAFWLGAARGEPGARVIDRLVRTERDDNFREHLTFVLTLTPGGGIERLLDMARHDANGQVRGQALFWLAQKAGARSADAIRRAVDDDPDSEVRTRAVFALSQLPKDDGVPKLIELARSHRDPAVRKQAMFWLGQSGDARAIAFFEQVLAQK